jgi:hypothetical protein
MNNSFKACVLGLGMVVTIGGCGDAAGEDVGEAEDALFGRVEFQSVGSNYAPPFPAAFANRALEHARVVGVTSAFATCVQNSMQAQYHNCNDVNGSLSRSQQISEAWDSFRNSFANILHQHNETASGSLWSGMSGNGFDTHGINTHSQYNSENGFWAGLADYEPWHWNTGGMVHEFTHTLGYWHADGAAAQQACVNADPFDGWNSYYQDGEPSAPYIYGNCASAVVKESWEACGDIHEGCSYGRMRLLSSWTGTYGTDQTSGSCVCVRDPRHTLALETSSGHFVTADGASAGALTTATQVVGPNEFVTVMDRNGGSSWWGTDDVYLKSREDGILYRGGFFFHANGTSGHTMRLVPVSGSTVDNGDDVRIVSGGYYAYDDGAYVRPSLSSTGANRVFTVREPSRQHLVYLRTSYSTFVRADQDTGWMYGGRTQDELMEDSIAGGDAGAQRKASAAFWIIDWDGGELMDGDVVSLEAFENDGGRYVSIRGGNNTGLARLRGAIGEHEKFTINILDGTAGPVVYTNDGVANDHHRITFQTMTGKYLRAVALTPTSEPLLMGDGPDEGTYQRFYVFPVQEFDQHRPTW